MKYEWSAGNEGLNQPQAFMSCGQGLDYTVESLDFYRAVDVMLES